MNQSELKKQLDQEGIKQDCYSLEANSFDRDESLCLRQEGTNWTVYYSERGLQTGKQNFKLESDACAYILKELQEDPTTRKDWSSGFSL